MSAKVQRFATAPALARAASARFLAAAREAVDARGRFCVVLPGGRTPVVLFRALREEPTRGALPWESTHVFFTDERCVPLEDGSSNYGLAKRELLDHVPVPIAQVHRVPVEAGAPAAVAQAWEAALRRFFTTGERYPAFDLVVLGIGTDGHTASLFPGDAALDADERWVMPVAVRGTPPVARVTLTLPVLDQARAAMFLAAGADKRAVLEAIASDGAGVRATYPAARVEPRGATVWLYSEAGV